MDLNYRHLLPAGFAPDSRVWIYQCNRMLAISEALQLEPMLESFVASWNSHGTPVKGYANLFFGQFLVLVADESATGVSGCSTDSSVRLVKQAEQIFNVSFFDRQLLAFVLKDKVQLLPLSQFNYSVEHHFIDGDTLYFNNLVATIEAFENDWVIPVKNSWLAKKLSPENKLIS